MAGCLVEELLFIAVRVSLHKVDPRSSRRMVLGISYRMTAVDTNLGGAATRGDVDDALVFLGVSGNVYAYL